eukprot:TRINITY_DN504_c0_g1_i1.p1 TRINITY_DN504_c0_g1~~TRINITY_DN504_c0_g1_i1.p1  ORF type:complete len:511 (-),score=125.21 TRINITY_DN504_c0_g1_i1:78-1610(-)
MSKDWEIVQEKAFTSWVNGVLKGVNESITDITTDFNDGIKLILFLELLSGKKIGKKVEMEAKSRIHKIQNLHIALKFVEELDVVVQGIGSEDFVDNNKKLILGFLWTLYRKYRIAVIKEGDKSSEEGLLQWCKNQTSDYSNVEIKSFKTGFRDGNAFLALTHKFNPDLFNYDDESAATPEAKLEKAFELAEKTMNVPKLLDVSEVMKGTTDERSLILYTSLYFHAYSAQAQRLEAERAQREAANRLAGIQGSLASAQQSKEELLRKLAELEGIIQSKDQEIADLRSIHEKDVSELKAAHEKSVGELKASHETQVNTHTESHNKLQSELDDIKKKSSDLEAKHNALTSKFSDLEEKHHELTVQNKNSANLAEEEGKKSAEHSQTISKVQSERDELSRKLEAAIRDRDAANAKIAEQSKRADSEFSLLLVLRQQFDQHVLDMHRWRRLLEVDTGDFLTEVKTPLLEELSKEGDFDKQVELLRGKLTHETTDIQSYLQASEEFHKQKIKKVDN